MQEEPASLLRVLFICVHNSARSQMAEAYANIFGKGAMVAESAGLEPGVINPLVVEVMGEMGVNLEGKPTQSVFELYSQGNIYDFVITVCNKEVEEKCPIFPGVTRRLMWPFPDPAALTGPHAEKLQAVRQIRDQIKEKVHDFVSAVRFNE